MAPTALTLHLGQASPSVAPPPPQLIASHSLTVSTSASSAVNAVVGSTGMTSYLIGTSGERVSVPGSAPDAVVATPAVNGAVALDFTAAAASVPAAVSAAAATAACQQPATLFPTIFHPSYHPLARHPLVINQAGTQLCLPFSLPYNPGQAVPGLPGLAAGVGPSQHTQAGATPMHTLLPQFVLNGAHGAMHPMLAPGAAACEALSHPLVAAGSAMSAQLSSMHSAMQGSVPLTAAVSSECLPSPAPLLLPVSSTSSPSSVGAGPSTAGREPTRAEHRGEAAQLPQPPAVAAAAPPTQHVPFRFLPHMAPGNGTPGDANAAAAAAYAAFQAMHMLPFAHSIGALSPVVPTVGGRADSAHVPGLGPFFLMQAGGYAGMPLAGGGAGPAAAALSPMQSGSGQ